MNDEQKLKLAKAKKAAADLKKQEILNSKERTKATTLYLEKLAQDLNLFMVNLNAGFVTQFGEIKKFSNQIKDSLKEIDNKTDLQNVKDTVAELTKKLDKGIKVTNLQDIKPKEPKDPKDYTKTIEAVANVIEDVSVGISRLQKELPKLKPSQAPEEFIPYRRVIFQNNKFQFDDRPTGSGGGGGGGGGSSSGVDPVGLKNIAGDTINPAEATASTATLSNVSASASSTQLLAANTNRLGAIFFNDSIANLYLKFGTTASTTSFTVKIGAGGYYEIPIPGYTGRIDGIWSAANGSCRITELS